MKGIFWKKPIEKVLEVDPGLKHLDRSLGLFGLILMGVGATIGAGISLTVGAAIGFSGPSLFISFAIAGIAAIFAALGLAELASMMPVSGSIYSYTYVTFGEIWAWIMGFILLIQTLLGVAVLAQGWSEYLVALLISLGTPLPEYLVHVPFLGSLHVPEVLIIILVSGLLILGVKESSRVNAVVMLTKIFVIMLVLLIGIRFISPANYHPFMPYGWWGVFQGAAIVFFTFGGFEAVTAAAEEVKNPQKNLPIAILGSLGICFAIYIAMALVLSGVVPHNLIKDVISPLSFIMHHLDTQWAADVLAIGSIAGISSTILVALFFQSRVFYAMGRDKILPGLFSDLHPKFKTPVMGTIIICAATLIVASILSTDELIAVVTLGSLSEFIIISAAVIILRKRLPDFKRPFKCPLVPVVPLLSIISCGFLITQIPFSYIGKFIIFLLCSLPLYFLYRMKKNGWKLSN
jgi:basic amino acid/polyamine antiporter, APA family